MTLAVLIPQQAVLSAPDVLLTGPGLSSVPEIRGLNAADIAESLRAIPSELGSLQETFIPAEAAQKSDPSVSQNPVVIHIQDAHANVEAQERIRDILGWVRKSAAENGVPGPVVVALEGSVGSMHPEYLELFPEFPAVNEVFVEDLKLKGELTGSDLYQWEQYKERKNPSSKRLPELIFWGAENPESYRNNLSEFRQLMFKREEIDSLLKPFESLLSIAQSRILNPQLRDFLRDSERTEVLALSILRLARQTLGIDLSDRIEQLRFPNLTRFAYVREIEPLLDAELARMDWKALEKDFQKQGIPEDVSKKFGAMFYEKGETGVSFRQIAEEVYREPGASQIQIRDYPHLVQWASYRILSQEISSAEFVAELELLKNAVVGKLAVKDSEKAFTRLHADFLLFRKKLHLEITRDEHGAIQSQAESQNFPDLSKRLFSLISKDRELEGFGRDIQKNAEAIQDFYDRAADFYQGAKLRDQEMLENALSHYKNLQGQRANSAGAGPGVIVLVTGGFHSEGMTQYLKDREIPHLVVVPRISNLGAEDLYAKVMRLENAEMKKYFENNPLNKQESLVLKGILEKASPELVQRHGVPLEELANWIEKAVRRHPVLSERLVPLVLGSQDKKFVRISTAPPKQAPDPRNRTVNEISILTAASPEKGGSYPYLAGQAPLTTLVTVDVIPGLGGVLGFQPSISAITDVLKGGVAAQYGPIDRQLLQNLSRLQVVFNPKPGKSKPGPVRRDASTPARLRSELRSANDESGRKVGEILLESGSFDAETVKAILKDHDVIRIGADVPDIVDYEEYKGRFEKLLEFVGKALSDRSAEEDAEPQHKVIVMRTWNHVGSTQMFFQLLQKVNPENTSASAVTRSVDVVYQPDFSHRDERGQWVDGPTVFGLRNFGQSMAPEEAERQKKTIQLLETYFPGTDFLSAASAEMAKNDLLLYLAAKLAHFNDLARVAERYGADLSVVAYGAGLDKRILTLFANPSLGFGGRLAQYLEWLRDERIEEVLPLLEQSPSFFTDSEKQQSKSAKIDILKKRVADSVAILREIAEKPDSNKTVKDILQKLPASLHFLFQLETILEINKMNVNEFFERIKTHSVTLQGKSAAIVGAAYRQGENGITKSPAKRLIRSLVAAGVREFYVVDRDARNALKAWLDEVRNNSEDSLSQILGKNHVRFVGVDEGTGEPDIYEAAEKADFMVIATDSEPALKNLDLKRLKNSLKDKTLFDGINLFGLRADGKTSYSLEDFRTSGIRYVSVGRPPLNIDSNYALKDSRVLGDVAGYQKYLLSLEPDLTRRDSLDQAFGSELPNQGPLIASPVISKNVAVIGGGYVGLTTGANLADLGHNVTVVDIPQRQRAMDDLNSEATQVPIHEPGLRDLIIKGKTAERIRFEAEPSKYTAAVEAASVVYLAVGTPQQDNGAQDPAYINGAVRQIGAIIKKQKINQGVSAAFKTIVIKSTVTPQVFEDAARILLEEFGLTAGFDYALVSNPEFLREGQAIKDITSDLDRTVLGFYSAMSAEGRQRAERDLLELWYPLMHRKPHTVLLTDTATATLIKYAANAFLAVSITSANVMAQDVSLQDEADFEGIRKLLLQDGRIGPNAFLYPGCGYGGSCFPKDVRAANYISDVQAGHPLLMIVFADQMNQYFKTADIRNLMEQLRGREVIGDKVLLRNKVVSLLGMAFKPDTDDMRESPSAHILYELLKLNAGQVRIDDPIFRIPDAPPRESILANYAGELYKHFSHDEEFLKEYEIFLQTNYFKDPETGKKLFSRLRMAPQFRRQLADQMSPSQSQYKVDEAAFDETYSLYFDPGSRANPWDDRTLKQEVREPLIRAFNELLETRRADMSAIREFYFREVYFKRRYLETQRVVFVSLAQDALQFSQPGRGETRTADAVIVVTDWREYKELDLTILPAVVIDTRNAFRQRAPEIPEITTLVVPGRSPFSKRSELRRSADPPVHPWNSSKGPLTDTLAFRELVRNLLETIVDSGSAASDLRLSQWAAVERIATFFPLSLLNSQDAPIVSFLLGRLLGESSAAETQVPEAVRAAREALGPYAWLLEGGKTPARVLVPMGRGQLQEDLLRVALVLLAADPQLRFVFLLEGNAEAARRESSAATEAAADLKLGSQAGQRMSLVAYEGVKALVRLIKQHWAEAKEVQSAVLSQDLALLQSMGYIPQMGRIHNDSVPGPAAIMVTAALLRQLQDAYDPQALSGLLQRNNVRVNDLVDRVQSMINVLRHLATQA